MAGIIVSPSTENKIRLKNAAIRLTHGIPDFKDVLRKRFRRRIRESRGKFMDKVRALDGSTDRFRTALKEELSDIVNVMDHDSEDQMDFIEGGPTEEEEWILHHYNLLLSDDDTLQQLYEESMRVVCPICFKAYLQTNTISNMIVCSSCTLKLPARASLQEISAHLSHGLDSHDDSGCQDPVQFMITQEDCSVHLYAVYSACSFLNVIV